MIMKLHSCRPREGCGLHPEWNGHKHQPIPESCRPREGCGLHRILGLALVCWFNVAVPARGAGCISKRIQTRISTFVGSIQPAGSV